MNVDLKKFIQKQMLTPQMYKKLNEGEALDEDVLNEDDTLSEASEPKPMSEEDLKIESLKIATNIAKLMSDVTTDDIISIASKVADFIRDHSIGADESSSDNKEEDITSDLDLDSESNNEGNK